MFSKTRIYSVLFNKCPKCHEGKFFIDNNPYKLKTFSKQNSCCSKCNESFSREPGFYYGAMYASYGLTVLYGIILFLITVLLFKMEVLNFLILFSVTMVLLMPWLYRTSRLIWINIFVGPKK